MPEALEAEKRDAVKFPSGIENQKPRAVITVRGSFLPVFMAFFMATGAAFEFLLCHNKFWRKRCP